VTGVEIVKVQTPLPSGEGPALIYAEGREREELRGLDARETALMRGDPKAFFRARWDDRRKGWSLLMRTTDPGL
jgi:hypothetical protein